ncbi:unnamed protein product [Absidia cylindrospora]
MNTNPSSSKPSGQMYQERPFHLYRQSHDREQQPQNRRQQKQPSQQSHRQQSQQSKQIVVNEPGDGASSRESLLEEISKRKRQIDILETRAMEAEKKYIQFATLEETEPQRQLREYKQQAERKYTAYDTEVRSLHHLAKTLEQQLSEATTKMDENITELIRIKSDEKKHQGNIDGEWLSGIIEYRNMHEACITESDTLVARINELKKRVKDHQNLAKNTGPNTIPYLTSLINFSAKFTGLTIIDYDMENDASKVTCRQTGKLGSIEYRLELFTDSDDRKQAYYIPLKDELDDRNLATSMNSELQFGQADVGVFIWRLMTYLNRSKGDKK